MQIVKKGAWIPTKEELLAESVLVKPERMLHKLVGTSEEDTRMLWLEARRNSIGASDVSAIMGTSNPKYQSRYKLWHEKMGLTPIDPEQTEVQLFGHLMEETATKAFSIQFAKGEVVDPKGMGIRHNLFPWMTASIDRALVLDDGDAKHGLDFATMLETEPLWIPIEIKNVSEYKTDEWTISSIPDMYYDQVQAQLEVTAKPRALVIAVFGGNRMGVYTVWRDVVHGAKIVRAAQEFWDSIQSGDCPPPDDSEATLELLKGMFPNANGETIPLTPEMLEMCSTMSRCDQEIEAAEKRKQEASNALRAAMGSATKATGGIYSVHYGNRTTQVVNHDLADKDEELMTLKGRVKEIENTYKEPRISRTLKVTENRAKV